MKLPKVMYRESFNIKVLFYFKTDTIVINRLKYKRIIVPLRNELSVLNLNLNGIMTIEISWSVDKMSKGINGSFRPIVEENNPNSSCDRRENQKTENKILFISPFHSMLLNRINPQTILINENTSNIIFLFSLILFLYDYRFRQYKYLGTNNAIYTNI